MPDFIGLNAIEEWTMRFDLDLQSIPISRRVVLLIDANRRQFESTPCLKRLRDFLTTHPVIRPHGVKIAFVQPVNVMTPQIDQPLRPILRMSRRRIDG